MDHRTLRAADGLELRFGAAGMRVAWRGTADWLGPLQAGLASPDGGTSEARLLGAEACGGGDDLGRYSALDLRYALEGLPLHTSVRAYEGRPLLVFRTAAEADL